MSRPLSILDRPTPIREAFRSPASVVGWLVSLVASGVALGLLTEAQSSALVALLGLVPGLIGAAVTAWRAIARAEAQTTPVDEPAMVVDGELVRAELVPVDELPRHRFGA